jgi:ornithine carbamoyltransferase
MRRKKDFIKVEDLSTKEILKLFKMAHRLKKDPFSRKKVLRYKTAALLFQKPSNRTRISFEVAASHLGAYVLYLSPAEIAMGKREPVKDVARVISRYTDLIVARVFSHEDIEMLAKYSDVPVINGLSDLEHPCQALADIFTVQEKIGRTRGVNLAYVGDGNNVLNSLMMACAMTGMNIKAAVPRGYSPPEALVEKAAEAGRKRSCVVELVHDPEEADEYGVRGREGKKA